MCPKEHPCVMEQQKRSWHWLYTDTAAARCQLQNKLQWKTLSSMYLLALICIHPWVNWHLKLERVLSCCQMPVAKQTSMETKLSSSYLLALICIHPIYLSTNIWLERAWGSAKKRSWHCTQLPVASCKAWGSLTSNICSNYLVEKDTSSDLCMTAEGNLIDQRCKTLNGKRVCWFDFFYSSVHSIS